MKVKLVRVTDSLLRVECDGRRIGTAKQGAGHQQLLPGASAAHMQRHRIELKKFGAVTIYWNEEQFTFKAIPKE